MPYRKLCELQNISGSKAKQAYLESNKDDEQFKALLIFAENPFMTYNVSEKTLRRVVQEYKQGDSIRPHAFADVFECCSFLSGLRAMDGATLHDVQTFLCEQCPEEEREVYIKLLSKTLRLGVTAKTINKAIGNIVPEWEVQQAYPFEKHPLPCGEKFWLTEKLNGVRATYYKGHLVARSGARYKGLEHITNELRYASERGIVLDGELTLIDKSGKTDNEAFRAAAGIINSEEDCDKTAICYTVFDAIREQDFESGCSVVPYSTRRKALEKINRELCPNIQYTRVLPVLYEGTDQSAIWSLLDRMVAEDKEGLMLNTDVPYKRSRHKGILKVKRFYTMDLPIIRCDIGTGRLSDTLGSLVVSYNGNEVNVGTGFTDEQRALLWAARDELPGVLCEVKYKEVSYDQKTKQESLQFPVFVGLRTDKTEESHG